MGVGKMESFLQKMMIFDFLLCFGLVIWVEDLTSV